MPLSFDHEALVALFRNEPRLGPALLDAIGFPVEADRVELGSADLSELRPTERRADVVLHTFRGSSPGPTLVFEVQGRPDEDKRFVWPQYLCSQRAMLRREVVLVVFTLDLGTARWAARPIETGHPGFALRPLVIGPDAIPLVLDPELAARLPELAVVGTLAHAADSQVYPAALAALRVVCTLDTPRSEMYADIILWALHKAAPAVLELLMHQPYEFKSEFARHYIAIGKQEGLEKGIEKGIEEGLEEGRRRLLHQLARRYGPLPDWVPARVAVATSEDLDAWADALFDAPTVEALFSREP